MIFLEESACDNKLLYLLQRSLNIWPGYFSYLLKSLDYPYSHFLTLQQYNTLKNGPVRMKRLTGYHKIHKDAKCFIAEIMS